MRSVSLKLVCLRTVFCEFEISWQYCGWGLKALGVGSNQAPRVGRLFRKKESALSWFVLISGRESFTQHNRFSKFEVESAIATPEGDNGTGSMTYSTILPVTLFVMTNLALLKAQVQRMLLWSY